MTISSDRSITGNTPAQDQEAWKLPVWVDDYTIKAIQCIAVNILLEIEDAPIKSTLIFNVVLRFWSSYNAFKNKEYHKFFADILATAFSLTPEGRIATIILDIGWGVVVAHEKYKRIALAQTTPDFLKPLPRIDCTNRENALNVLGLDEETAKSEEKVEEQYLTFLDRYSEKVIFYQNPRNKFFLTYYNKKVEEVEEAYETVQKLFGHKQD